jgi:hypothetical protein
VAAAAVVLGGVAAVVAAVALGGGGRDSDEPVAGWVSECPAAPSVCITSVQRGEAGVTAQFTSNGVDLVANAAADELQAVFFLAAIGESQAAGIETRTQAWQAWGPKVPFEGFTGGEADGSTALCVLVGNGAGQVARGTGNCAQLPVD